MCNPGSSLVLTYGSLDGVELGLGSRIRDRLGIYTRILESQLMPPERAVLATCNMMGLRGCSASLCVPVLLARPKMSTDLIQEPYKAYRGNKRR